MKGLTICLLTASMCHGQLHSMESSKFGRQLQLEFALKSKISARIDTLPSQIPLLVARSSYYRTFKSSIEPRDRTRCPKPTLEQIQALESSKQQLISYKTYSKSDIERLTSMRKSSLGICDEVVIGFADTDSLMKKYYEAYLKMPIDALRDTATIELLGTTHKISRRFISDSIGILNSGHLIFGSGTFRNSFYGEILFSIYGPEEIVSSCASSSKICTDQKIEEKYFLSGIFQKNCDSTFRIIEDFLAQKKRNARLIDSLATLIIERNSIAISNSIDSLVNVAVARNKAISREKAQSKFDEDFEQAIRLESVDSSQDYIRSTNAWSIIDYLSQNTRPAPLLPYFFKEEVRKGMTIADVQSFDGYYLANATINTLPGQVEIYSFVGDGEARVYTFKKGILQSHQWSNVN